MLKNKVAIVTGGGRGIGRTISLLLAKHGAKIAVCELFEETAQETCSIINNEGGDASAFSVDVRDSSKVNETINKVIDKYGKICFR